ncbi:MAG: restriction endonuclease subunit S [Patescibacteria group bacterium]|nr:restriction endonuclease subunit S [Patescibacteria group bacterium]
MSNAKVTIPKDWKEVPLNDPRYFSVVGSGVDFWIGKKNFLSTKSVQGTKIVAIEGEIDYLNRPSRANAQPKVGRVAFAKMKDTFKVLLADETLSKKYILSTGFALIEPSIDSSYLYQFFQSENFNAQKNRYSEGSTQQAISQDDFSNLLITFPENRDEQKSIAGILGLVDQVIEETEALIKKYEHLQIGMMQDLFRYGIDENGNLRTFNTHKFKKTALGLIPESWKVGGIENFTDISNPNAIKPGPFGSNLKKETYTENGYKVYGQEQVLAGNAHIGDYYIDKKKYRELEAFRAVPGDILLSMMGSVGSVLILPNDALPGVINPRLIKISVSSSKADVNFVATSLLRPETNHQLYLMASGVTMPGINKGIVMKLQFVIPDKAEQKRISDTLSYLSNLINAEKVYRDKLLRQRNGLMHDLLTGVKRATSLIRR